MEFDCGVWLGPSTLHCVDGRQLGEENAWPVFFREHVATDYHASNMPGSRSGSVINMTALHMVMRTWNQALPVMGAMRRLFDDGFGAHGKTLGMRELFVVSKMGCALPALMVRRGQAPLRSGQIPALVATQFKLIAGFFMVAQEMLWGNARHDPHVSAEDFFEFADREGIFISPSGRACGGSKKKIIELFNYLQAVDADTDMDALTQYAEPGQLLTYTTHALYIECVILLVQRALRCAYFQWVHEHGRTGNASVADTVLTACSDVTEPRLTARLAHLNDNAQLWQLVELLATAQLDTPVSLTDARALVEQIAAGTTQLDNEADVVAHYRAAADRVRQFMTAQQHAVLAILGRRERPALADDRLFERLAVLPLSL